jgi:hypothetical protein
MVYTERMNFAVQSDDLFNLVSSSGTVHRITNSGIYTNDRYQPFPGPLDASPIKAGTSISGEFLYFLIGSRLVLITIADTGLSVDQLGDPGFIDAAFTADDSRIFGLTSECQFHIFLLLPVAFLMTFIFETPSPPVSFTLHQLQKSIDVVCSDSTILLLKLPTAVSLSSGSPYLLDIREPVEMAEVAPIELAEEEEAEREDFISRGGWGSVLSLSSPSDLARFVDQRTLELFQKQETLIKRYHSLILRLDNAKTRSRVLSARQTILKGESAQLIQRVLSVITRKSGCTELESQSRKFDTAAEKLESVHCDDDAVSDVQLQEFRSFHFMDRLRGLEKRFTDHEETTLFF